MTGPTTPSAFDPRRLADLASRLSARPAPPAPQSPGAQPREDEPTASQPGTGADEAPRPAGVGEEAGHLQIDAVLAELKRAEQLPPDQQIPVYEAIHRTLQETLRSIEQS
ncbi:hypothetical protein HC031_19095 [Planosporangium thailandense]|uniref:Uncharacterized protein n=1 Tax=Planosporangium thailandense TaxID=765197 RepID=A0ABX0Y314_9ACTN|nr:hypothetical protein [Planosporangium thailandense]NJC71810.1 hypothetical protein [Planosporangium thailandense]